MMAEDWERAVEMAERDLSRAMSEGARNGRERILADWRARAADYRKLAGTPSEPRDDPAKRSRRGRGRRADG
jgi:hypothetical protein